MRNFTEGAFLMVFQPAVDFINNNDKFILTAHETPDGDALGSECAMYFALHALGKTVRIFNADPMPGKFSFIDSDGIMTTLESENQLPFDLEDYVLIILDTNDIKNIGQVSTMVLPRVKDSLIIDHHDSGGSVVKSNLIIREASSTCEILFELFTELKLSIDFPAAQSLFVGIVYDTGSFIYPKTTAKTFDIAHELVKKGVEPNYVYTKVYESNSISSLVLQSKVLGTLELFMDDHIAVQTMLKSTLEECGAFYEEADSLINIPLKSEQIRVSIFFKENNTGILRCSLRSKDNIDVSVIAQHYNGGGHKTAAGFKCKESLDDIKSNVLKMLEKYFTA